MEAIQGESYSIHIESTVDRELGVVAFVDGKYHYLNQDSVTT